jgi:hypothetical protein
MDVRLPDGQIITNVPDGTTKAALVAKLQRNGYTVPAEWMSANPVAQSSDAAPLSRIDKISQGMKDPFDGGAQLLTKMLPGGMVNAGNAANNWLAEKTGLVGKLPAGGVDQQVREQESAYQAKRAAAGESGIDGYRLIGNAVSPANLAIGAAAPAAGALLPGAATLTGRIGAGVAAGMGTNSIAPVASGDYWSEKVKQIGIGAGAGAMAPLAAAGLSRVISPKASVNPDVALLKSEGVNPTIGQTLGGRWNSLEEKLTSLPIVGDAIASARGKALTQFNSAAINRAASPIGERVDGVGQKAVADAGNALSKAYDDAIGQVKFIRFDSQFAQDAVQLKSMAQSLTPPMRSKFNALFDDVVGGRTSVSGTMLGETVKKVDSELGVMAGRFGKSSVASEQELADSVKQLQSLLRQQVARSNPDAAAAMKAADTGWANLVRVEGAAKSAKNADGIFTPAQLNMAIQTADNSVRKRAVSRGSALMQDLGNAGQNVLGNKVPNSGTAERLMYGGGAALGGYALNPWIPAGLLGGAAVYSPPVQSLLRGAVSARPDSAQAIAEALKKSAPMLGPVGGLLGLQLSQ